MKTDFIGLRVLNVWHQGCDYPEHVRLSYHGTVIEYLPGCNALFKVKFDDRDWATWQSTSDLAEVSTWPASRGIFDTL